MNCTWNKIGKTTLGYKKKKKRRRFNYSFNGNQWDRRGVGSELLFEIVWCRIKFDFTSREFINLKKKNVAQGRFSTILNLFGFDIALRGVPRNPSFQTKLHLNATIHLVPNAEQIAENTDEKYLSISFRDIIFASVFHVRRRYLWRYFENV